MNLMQLTLGWLKQLTTGPNNASPCFIRIGAILLGSLFMFLSAYTVVIQGKDFDAIAYATATAAILGGSGLGAKLKPEDAAPDA